jgi:hypothetical protein
MTVSLASFPFPSDAAGGVMRQNYLIEHTVGSIIRGAFKIYGRHFGTLFLMFILPVIPASIIQQEFQSSGSVVLAILGFVLTLVVTLFASAATTVAVSDICIGNVPSIKRSYTKILDKIVLRLLGTNLLQALAIVVGCALLVIPGLVLLIWLMLSPSIVVLENRSGIAALKRSKQLGDGSHWRNAGLMLLLTIVLVVTGAVIGGVTGFVGALLFPDVMFQKVLSLVTSLYQGLTIPLTFIAAVLVYYDRRVRKEGYDAEALAEDLAR